MCRVDVLHGQVAHGKELFRAQGLGKEVSHVPSGTHKCRVERGKFKREKFSALIVRVYGDGLRGVIARSMLL